MARQQATTPAGATTTTSQSSTSGGASGGSLNDAGMSIVFRLANGDQGPDPRVAAHHELLPTHIYGNVWQGAGGETGESIVAAGFDFIVLCAEDRQDTPHGFPSNKVIHAPLDDDGRDISPSQQRAAVRYGEQVGRLVTSGAKILITCNMGMNRSALVTGLALRSALHMSGEAAFELVRNARRVDFANPGFTRFLRGLPPPT